MTEHPTFPPFPGHVSADGPAPFASIEALCGLPEGVLAPAERVRAFMCWYCNPSIANDIYVGEGPELADAVEVIAQVRERFTNERGYYCIIGPDGALYDGEGRRAKALSARSVELLEVT